MSVEAVAVCKCGQSLQDSIGANFGQCQDCWEDECARLWWKVLEPVEAEGRANG